MWWLLVLVVFFILEMSDSQRTYMGDSVICNTSTKLYTSYKNILVHSKIDLFKIKQSKTLKVEVNDKINIK